MNCICGCGTRLDRDQIELNLLAGEVAIELVVWDKARALGSPVAAGEVEGRRAALLQILEARGIATSPAIQTRIAAADLPTLKAWTKKAAAKGVIKRNTGPIALPPAPGSS